VGRKECNLLFLCAFSGRSVITGRVRFQSQFHKNVNQQRDIRASDLEPAHDDKNHTEDHEKNADNCKSHRHDFFLR